MADCGVGGGTYLPKLPLRYLRSRVSQEDWQLACTQHPLRLPGARPGAKYIRERDRPGYCASGQVTGISSPDESAELPN